MSGDPLVAEARLFSRLTDQLLALQTASEARLSELQTASEARLSALQNASEARLTELLTKALAASRGADEG